MSELGKTISEINEIGVYKSRSIEMPKTPIGIKTPLEKGKHSKGETLFKMHFDISNQIEDNLKNLIMTQKGERLGFPDYGTNLRQIYSNNTLSQEEVANIASNEINSVVSKYMPSISLTEFYSSRVNDSNQKENASNIAGLDMMNAQNQGISINDVDINKTNIENINTDSIFEITISYSIPLLQQQKKLTLRINSSE